MTSLDADLTVYNVYDPDAHDLMYYFELDTANTFDSPKFDTSGAVSEGFETTVWSVYDLADNTRYFWRAKASDGASDSGWTTADFFVNLANDPPSAPTLKNPGSGASVDSLFPTLAVNPATDVDKDTVSYRFELYVDQDASQIATADVATPAWTVPDPLIDNTWYYWRARAEDEHGSTSDWLPLSAFFVNNDGYDDPPTISDIAMTPGEVVVGDQVLISWQDNDPDSNAMISLYYDSDNSGTDGMLIAADIQEDDETDIFTWDTADMMTGVYYLYAVVDDTSTTASAYSLAAVTILPDNEPPALDPIGNRTGNEGELLTFEVTAIDPNPEDVLTFGGANLPDGAVIDPETGVFFWTSTYEQAGNYENVEFFVTDNGDPMGVDSELITITIGQINRPPVFVPVGSQAVLENELLLFAVLASDPDGDSFDYAASGLPDGADFNSVTAVFSWTPDNSQAGAYIVEFSATDNDEPPAVGILQAGDHSGRRADSCGAS